MSLLQGVTMRIRYAAATCAGALALASSAGCTVPVAGATGITVTRDGRPVGVLMVCHHHIDAAILYSPGPGDESEDVGSWRRAEPATGYLTWPLHAGGEGWSVHRAMPTALEGQRTYVLYGTTEDNSWSTNSVSFTRADLAALTPGQVRYSAGDVPGADEDGNLTSSIEDFRAHACDDD
ncbi:hypothetical protein OHS71_36215 [Streptomyces sp. NBC_00377]|uniref:hypothetical protein n=1 Tax=unclassified Streptomyces TaxID=2593676 RepID=UPI002E23D192|nr:MULTISPECIES: hypothetical protein [unclassified Streptomyces]